MILHWNQIADGFSPYSSILGKLKALEEFQSHNDFRNCFFPSVYCCDSPFQFPGIWDVPIMQHVYVFIQVFLKKQGGFEPMMAIL